MTTVRDRLIGSIVYAGRGVDGDESQAAAILWTDPDLQWQSVIDDLAETLDLVMLGSYDPDKRQGPAIWVRAAVAGLLDEPSFESPIVVYLPGVAREDFRNLEDCPDELRPLAELQYRGAFWSQTSGRDWTPVAFIQNRDRGLGIEVKADQATVEAIEQMLPDLLDRSTEWLRNKSPVDASVLYSLADDDPVRTLLQWIDDPTTLDGRSQVEQAAFRSKCDESYGLSVDVDGPIGAARKLAEADGAWRVVWRRYREAPGVYSGVEERLRQAAAAGQGILSLGLDTDEPVHAWPQHNESEEKTLRESLAVAASLPRDELVDRLNTLEGKHGTRRNWVWAELGRSPVAQALQHLVALGDSTPVVQNGSINDLAAWYAAEGRKAEDAVRRALAAVSNQVDRDAVYAVVDALYGSWSDHSARVFQKAVVTGEYVAPSPRELPPSTCVLFTDGLRLDLGHRLADLIRSRGLTVTVETQLAALPTITATAKPALTPVADSLESGPGLEPTTNGTTKVNATVLRAAMNEVGIQTLQVGEVGDTSGRAWTEIGSIDSDGHSHGIGLAARAEDDLVEIAQRVSELAQAGWRNIEIVTDHGFLLMPEPMKKAELPEHLVGYRKGRCARLGADDEVGYETIAWRWDPEVRWAIAPGTSCFVAGKQYEHGGVSLPECVVPHLKITRDLTVQPVSLSKPRWRGMRMTVEGAGHPAAIDLRTKPADPTSSLLEQVAEFKDGKAKAVVTDTDAEGMAAVVVALDENGNLVGQVQTVVGEM